MKYENLICPVCNAELMSDGKSLFCKGERKHCYDIAKSGYVNLLPPGKMSNAKAGDDNDMLMARRDFLATGSYDKISESLADIICKFKPQANSFLDAGCGEGYHTLKIYEKTSIPLGIGIDASKHGADKAAKKCPDNDLTFIAGNIFNMPVKDKSQDAVVSMFAPVPDAEAQRVLKDDGILVVCSSGDKHLYELRQLIYDNVIVSPVLSRTPEGFELADTIKLDYKIKLEHNDLVNLFKMTPFYYRTPLEGHKKIEDQKNLDVTVQVQYSIYKKL